MKYYSIERPIGPGTYPRGGLIGFENFAEGRRYCEEIGRKAWGVLEYSRELSYKEMSDYELILSPFR